MLNSYCAEAHIHIHFESTEAERILKQYLLRMILSTLVGISTPADCMIVHHASRPKKPSSFETQRKDT
jgi:hypothetical protein